MSTLFILAFISYVIGNLNGIRKIIKKVNIAGLGFEFKNEEQKKFVDVAIELLENNFPILSNVGQEEVNKRVSAWIKDFLAEIEKQKIPVGDTKLFYDPDFQYVLNKAIETVGRRNNQLTNKSLIKFLIDRIKYNNEGREDLISQFNSAIIYDIPRLTENHYKLLCMVKFLVEIKNFFPNIETIEEFENTVVKGFELFYIEDVRVYEDLKNTTFIHDGGNMKLLSPQEELQDESQLSTQKIKRPIIFRDLYTYFSYRYPFLKDISNEQKEDLCNQDIFKECDILYQRILKNILILPFGDILIYDYMKNKLNETFKLNL